MLFVIMITVVSLVTSPPLKLMRPYLSVLVV
jgi:hypothetical protein